MQDRAMSIKKKETDLGFRENFINGLIQKVLSRSEIRLGEPGSNSFSRSPIKVLVRFTLLHNDDHSLFGNGHQVLRAKIIP